MATAEASPSTLGPRYAPDDPTLSEPWKGLIDGSTGLLYYWNPETNVTQYEKPTSLPPPLPPGPPPAAPIPKMNPNPGTSTSPHENVQTPQSQQPSQGQVLSFSLQAQVASQTPPGHIQGSNLQQTMQHGHLAPEQVRPQMTTQQPGQQFPSQLAIQPGQPGHPQSMQQMSMQPGHRPPYQFMQPMPHVQQGQMYPGAKMGSPHGFQFAQQHTQYTMHQPNMPPQGSPSSSEQSQNLILGQQLPQKQEHRMELGLKEDTDSHQGRQTRFSPAHQHLMQGQQLTHIREHKTGIPRRDDVDFQQVNQAGFSPAHIQQTGTPPVQNLTQNMSIQSNQITQYGESIVNKQTNNLSVHLQQTGTEVTHPHVSRFQNQMGGMGSGKMHAQQLNLPTVGSNVPYEENQFGRTGNEYFYDSKDVSVLPHQIPKLAPLPISRSQQDQRVSDFSPQNAAPTLSGRFNVGPSFLGGYGHSAGQYPNNTFLRPPDAIMEPSNPIHLSAAEIYCQKHEVTTTGENVPAPFMTFEAAGFPPELLQEVRYLLQRRSTCRTLQCYAHIYATTIMSF